MSIFVIDDYGKQSDAYANLAGLAVLAFDYCITLDDEVRWVWGRKWDAGRCIFTLARYLPFPGLSLTIFAAFQAVSFKQCNDTVINGYVSNVLHIVSILAAEGLILIRTWAFWGCSRILLISMIALAVVFTAASMTTTNIVDKLVPGVDLWPGICNFTTSRTSSIQYGFLVLYELILLSLIVYRWLHHYHSTGSKLVYVLYRDAVIHVVFMIVFSVANIINTAIGAQYYNEYIDSLQVTIHSVLSARIFFHLRQTNDAEHNTVLPDTISTFQVRRPDADTSMPMVSVDAEDQ